MHAWCCYVEVGAGSSCAASIDFVTAVVAAAVAVAAAAVATDIVATVSVRTIVAAAQGNAHRCSDSGWRLVAVDATIVISGCNLELYLHRLLTLQHDFEVPRHLQSTAYRRSYMNFDNIRALEFCLLACLLACLLGDVDLRIVIFLAL